MLVRKKIKAKLEESFRLMDEAYDAMQAAMDMGTASIGKTAEMACLTCVRDPQQLAEEMTPIPPTIIVREYNE